MAWKRLASALEGLADDARVRFAFDGEIMTIRLGNEVIAFPATGHVWPQPYSVPAEGLRHFLAKRLTQPSIGFSIWDGYLEVGNRRYSGADPGPGVPQEQESPAA